MQVKVMLGGLDVGLLGVLAKLKPHANPDSSYWMLEFSSLTGPRFLMEQFVGLGDVSQLRHNSLVLEFPALSTSVALDHVQVLGVARFVAEESRSMAIGEHAQVIGRVPSDAVLNEVADLLKHDAAGS